MSGCRVRRVGARCSVALIIAVALAAPLLTVTVAAASGASAPTLTAASYTTNAGVRLSFMAPAVEPGQTITDYEYQLSFDGGTTLYVDTLLGSATSPGVRSEERREGKGSYRIAAIIDGWRSPWSNWLATNAWNAPTLTHASYTTNGGVKLSFTAPAVEPGQTINDYEYQLSFDGGTTRYAVANLGTATSPGVASYCQQDQTCTYRIRAVVDGWQSPWSNWLAPDPWDAPVLTAAHYVTSGDIELTFTAPAIEGGQTITDYAFQLSFDDGSTLYAVSTLGDATSPAVAPYCSNGLRCTYRIAAVVDGWWTAWSNWRLATTLESPPPFMLAFGAQGVGDGQF